MVVLAEGSLRPGCWLLRPSASSRGYRRRSHRLPFASSRGCPPFYCNIMIYHCCSLLLWLAACVACSYYKVPSYYGSFDRDFFDNMSDVVEIEFHERVDEGNGVIYLAMHNGVVWTAQKSSNKAAGHVKLEILLGASGII
jgi:hypothetical protein